MIKPLITHKKDLMVASTDATSSDLYIVQDLKDTFRVTENCIGMAANMIGYNKRILIGLDGKNEFIIINPKILSCKDQYDTEEGCACFVGQPPIKTKRYQTIKLEYYNEKFQKRIKTYKGLTAQLIQHQLDHFEGKII